MTMLEAIRTGRRFRLPGVDHGWLTFQPGTMIDDDGTPGDYMGWTECPCMGTDGHPWSVGHDLIVLKDWITERTWPEFERESTRDVKTAIEQLIIKTCQAL